MNKIRKEIYSLEKFTFILTLLWCLIQIIFLFIINLESKLGWMGELIIYSGMIIIFTLFGFRVYLLKYERKELYLKNKKMQIGYLVILFILVLILFCQLWNYLL